MGSALPTPEVRAAIAAITGPFADVEDRSWPHGVTRVWRIVQPDGGRIWAKVHTETRKYDQEVRAYREVVPSLGASGVRVPVWVGRDDRYRLLVLGEVSGGPVDETDLEVHRSAGRALAALHAVPVRVERADPIPVAEALGARFRRWVDEGRGVLDAGIVDRARAALVPEAFVGCERSWCHRDWSPRNWLVDGDAAVRFGAIDFEHCAPDLWLVDLVRLADSVWRRIPGARAAFFDGYGRTLDPTDADRLHRLLWFHAVGTTVWAAAHRDAAYEAHGRGLLAELADGWTGGTTRRGP